jgi:alpha-N-arabinofuranosidase
VFEFYTVHHDAVLLPITISRGGWYALGVDSIPAVSASASRDQSGAIHVTMSNLDPNVTRTVTVDLQGATATNVTGRILSGDKMDAHNTFDRPDAVKPAPFAGARVVNSQLTVTLPAHSVVVLELR